MVALRDAFVLAATVALAGCANLDEMVKKNIESAMATANVCRDLEYSRRELVDEWKQVIAFYRDARNKAEDERASLKPRCDGNKIYQLLSGIRDAARHLEDRQDACIVDLGHRGTEARARLDALKAALDQIEGNLRHHAGRLEHQCRTDNRYCASYLVSVLFGGDSARGLITHDIQSLEKWRADTKELVDSWRAGPASCISTINGVSNTLEASESIFKMFKDEGSVRARDVIEVVFLHEVADSILTHLNRSLKGTEEQIYKLDEKWYGAISAGNLAFGGEIQEQTNILFRNLLKGTESTVEKRDTSELSQMVLVNLAASSCRRLLRDVDVGESQFLMPYVLRAIVYAAREHVSGYRKKLESIAPLFACTARDQEPRADLRRIDTALQLRRDNSSRQLGIVCARMREIVPSASDEFVYCNVAPDSRSAVLAVSPGSNPRLLERAMARLGDLVVAHGLVLEYEVLPTVLTNLAGRAACDRDVRSAACREAIIEQASAGKLSPRSARAASPSSDASEAGPTVAVPEVPGMSESLRMVLHLRDEVTGLSGRQPQ